MYFHMVIFQSMTPKSPFLLSQQSVFLLIMGTGSWRSGFTLLSLVFSFDCEFNGFRALCLIISHVTHFSEEVVGVKDDTSRSSTVYMSVFMYRLQVTIYSICVI